MDMETTVHPQAKNTDFSLCMLEAREYWSGKKYTRAEKSVVKLAKQ